jgi:hypothetical protein
MTESTRRTSISTQSRTPSMRRTSARSKATSTLIRHLIQKVRTAAGWFPVDDAICVQATTFAELGHSFFQCIVPLSNRCGVVIATALSREKGTFDSRLTRFEWSVRPNTISHKGIPELPTTTLVGKKRN